MKNTFEQYESEVRSYCRNYPVTFKYAKNEFIKDENNQEYIDFFCGAGALNYGHNNDYIKKELISYLQEDKIIHSLDMYTTAKREFIEYFEKNILEPRGYSYKIQFTGPTGTNAVEAALKLARKVKNRPGIFALMGAFHGMSLGALACTTDAESRAAGGVSLNNVTHIPAPYMFPELDTIEYVERILTDDHSGIEKPAAFIIEAVQADGGIYPLDPVWLQRLRALCDKHDILLIVDDIQAGCARSGWFFSFERAGIVPDIVTLSKSIGGYGFPLSLTLLKPELDVWSPGEHTGTFRGNQIAIVAAKAALEILLKDNIEEETKRKGEIIGQYLNEQILSLNNLLEVRGIGLIWGIDFNKMPDPSISKKMVKKCFENGLIVERAGRGNNVLKIMPPLTILDENLVKGLDIVKKSLREILEV